MSIEWLPEALQFHLRSDHLSYLMHVTPSGALGHLYLGLPLAPGRSYSHLAGQEFHGFSNHLGEPQALEYPVTGTGDYRVPALRTRTLDGSTISAPTYLRHRIFRGKPEIPGLPSSYVEDPGEATTLEVDLRDALNGLEVRLVYTIFTDLPIVARNARILSGGSDPIRLTTAMSLSLDLPDADWDLIQLSGAWARERQVVRNSIRPGRQSVGSSRGTSSHEHNPFVILCRPGSTESSGVALGLCLVYSGNFLAEVEVDSFGTARIRLGIDPETFEWTIEPGDSFATPEALLVYSESGLGTLSDALHELLRERLARGPWRDRPRPVLINNWEATYFAFDQTRILAMAEQAQQLGIELFLLDDGWFGERDDETSSLGDWREDRRKLPDGLAALAERIEAMGLRFGLWIEPEMVSPRSALFRAHPDWIIGVPGRPRTEGRHQLVLDLSRPEVVDHLYQVLSALLTEVRIAYVKWDMNRPITEPYSPSLPADRQGEFFHRQMLGVYDLYSRLTAAFPDVLFESCAAGGGRFDAGMMAFAPQVHTSDNTDSIERLRIQWGTSLAYPLSSIGTHVSAVPNHQVGRVTPLATRAAVAFFGICGYELDSGALSVSEKQQVADQITFYKRHRDLFQRGRFVRLRSPFNGRRSDAAWMAIAADRARAIVGYYRVLNEPLPGPDRLRLRGLDPLATYSLSSWPDDSDAPWRDGPRVRGGDDLMRTGLLLEVPRSVSAEWGDFRGWLLVLERIESRPLG